MTHNKQTTPHFRLDLTPAVVKSITFKCTFQLLPGVLVFFFFSLSMLDAASICTITIHVAVVSLVADML